MASKRHLARRRGLRIVAACGVVNPAHWSFLPWQVTCGGCQRTLYMADVEFRMRNRTRRSNMRNKSH